MHFSELFNTKQYPGGVLSVPDAEFSALIISWVKKMASCRYRRETRVERWQEAIDILYTELERACKTVDQRKIMSHKKWEIMMLAARTYFPEHISIYHPTPVEQQRVGKLIQNSKLRRILKDKLELLNILKEDKELKVRDITELTVSRIQCEVLAASAEALVANYRGGGQVEPSKVSAEAQASAEASSKGAMTSYQGAASFSAEASAAANYDASKRVVGGGLARIKASAQARAAAEGNANTEAYLNRLLVSAEAGISSCASASADIELEVVKKCRVKTAYLRRIFGDKFDLIKGYADGGAAVDLTAKGEAAMKMSGPGAKTGQDLGKSGAGPSADSSDLVDAHMGGEAVLEVKVQGHAGVTLMQTFDVQLSGDLSATASAVGDAQFFINGRGIGAELGGKVMAGFEVGTQQTFSVSHPSRRINIFNLKLRQSAHAGVAAEGRIKASLTTDDISFDTSAGVTVGVGTSLSCQTLISPRGAALAGYDLLVVPTILKLGEAMKRHDPSMGSVHTQHMATICNYLNRKASKAEVNQVFLDNQSRIITLIHSLDAEADGLLDPNRKMRVAGFGGYQSATLDDVSKTKLESSYLKHGEHQRKTPLSVVFGSEAEQGDAGIQMVNAPKGDIGKTITQKGLQHEFKQEKTDAVQPAKNNLHSVVAAYEQAKLGGSGECLAYEVIRKDLLSGSINYV